MIPEAVDRSLREFEWHTRSPATIRRAARLLDRLVDRGFDADLVQKIQALRLPRAVAHAAEHSPFYRQRFEDSGLSPGAVETVEDLQRLPFTTGDDLQQWRRFLCVPQHDVAAAFTTSGTTGEPKRVYYTLRELEMLTNLSAVAVRVEHADSLVALIALPMRHGLWMGWATAQRVIERAGGLPLPVGANDARETLQWMRRFEPNVLFSSPSYLTVLTRQAEQAGYRPRLDKVLLGGEALTAAQKARFTDYWQAQVFDSYGSTEIGGGQTIALPGCYPHLHLNDLHLLTEIVDPESGEAAEEGELVFTTLTREAMPLLRYRSGDRARWATCSGWIPTRAVELLGRLDDMIVAGDMNLYGQVMGDAILELSGSNGRVTIEVDKVDLTDRLRVQVGGETVRPAEVRQALADAYPGLAEAVETGNLVLEIESGADLDQIKAIKIRDRREAK